MEKTNFYYKGFQCIPVYINCFFSHYNVYAVDGCGEQVNGEYVENTDCLKCSEFEECEPLKTKADCKRFINTLPTSKLVKKQPIKCYLMCFNRWGYTTLRGEYPSVRAALRAKKDNGFSYIIYEDETRKKIIKKGFCE